jgi:hypothetical protein
MRSNRKLILIIFSSVIIFAGCSKDDNPVTPPDTFDGLTKISEAYTSGAGMKVQLWSKSSLFAGYNNIYIAVLDSANGTFVTDAHIHLEPMMDMGMMQHSAPFENPSSTIAVNNLFPCSVVFIMSSMGGTWLLNAEVHNHTTNLEGVASIPVTVNDVTPSVVKPLTALNDSSTLFVSYLKPSKLNVGINDFEITIHKKESMMDFPGVTDYTVVLTPEMPSMGHGSPNNVDPIHSGNGHYRGKVNFTMTGDWRLNLDIFKNGAVVDTTLYFDVTL